MDERAKAEKKQEHNLLIKMENQIRKEKLRKEYLNVKIAKARKMGDLSQVKEFEKQYEDEFDKYSDDGFENSCKASPDKSKLQST